MPTLPLTPLGVERLFYFLFLGFAVLVTALVYAIQHSNIGWALVAIREDEDAAEIVGVRTVEVKWAANALACFIAGWSAGCTPSASRISNRSARSRSTSRSTSC